MSVEQSAKAWKLNIQGSLKLVLLSLADHADSHGRHVFPSQDLISKRCGISVRQVRRLLNQLEALGLIIPVKYPKGGRNHTTEYELTLDQPETVETIEISNKPDVSGVSGIVSRLGGGYFVPEEFINQPLENIKAVNLSAFTEPDIKSKTRTNATQKADIYDIKADIYDIKADIAMSDKPSITVIEPSLETESGAHTEKNGPTLEYFAILETLPFWGGWSFEHCEKWRTSKNFPDWFAEAVATSLRGWLEQQESEYREYLSEMAIYQSAKDAKVKPAPTKPNVVKQKTSDPWLRFQTWMLKDWNKQPQKTTTPRQVAPANGSQGISRSEDETNFRNIRRERVNNDTVTA